MPIGASVRPWNHSVKRQPSSSFTRASRASSDQANDGRPTRASAITQ
jgi:hypothetical protein